jgi:hypothetical protein
MATKILVQTKKNKASPKKRAQGAETCASQLPAKNSRPASDFSISTLTELAAHLKIKSARLQSKLRACGLKRPST